MNPTDRSKTVRVSAPGKVIASGEYAVLDGAPAVVMAVDRRACVSLEETDRDWHRLAVPGLVEGALDFRVDAAGDVRLREPQAMPFDLSLVWQVWKAAGARPRRMLRLELDTRPFFHPARHLKLGFGSSAALAVALAFALLSLTRRTREAGDVARAAHRAWQGGRGSGADIAAAVHGGILGYRATAGGPPETLAWPRGLHRELLWSGRAASTRKGIAGLDRGRGGADEPASARLADAAEAVLGAWRGGAADRILACLSAYVRALDAFDVDRRLGIFDAGHRELFEAADGREVVYKPCGAGGGDIGMAVALDERALERFLDHARGLGFERLQVAPDSRGVEEYPDA